MKKTFVFVGSNVSDMMGVVSFRRFGQRAELTDEQARDLATGGSAIVPAASFDALRIPDSVLKRHAEFGTHGRPSTEFVDHRKRATAAAEEFRASHEFVIVGPDSYPGHFGQRLCLTAGELEEAIGSGIEIVRRARFDQCEFTPAELAAHPEFDTHADAPADFLAKKKQAAAAYQALCASLKPAAVEQMERVEEEV